MFKHSTLALALLAGALSGAAGAQDKPAGTYPAKPDDPAKKTAAAPAMPTSAGPARASDVIGTDIIDSSNNKVGEIDDLIIGKDNVVCALVDRKDVGLGAIPLDKLQARFESKGDANSTPEVDKFVVADMARLQSAPVLKDRDAMTSEWLKSTCDHYKGDGKSGMGETGKAEGERVAQAAEKPACAKKVIGKELEASDGDDVGEIQDLALDLKSGKVAYAILSVGGVLGLGEKHHAVALDKLTMSGDKYKVPATKQELKDKQGIDLAHLPTGPNLGGTAR